MLLTDTPIHILLSFFLYIPINSVLYLWISLWIYIHFIFFKRRVIAFFFIKTFFLLKAAFFHYNYVYDRIFLFILSLVVIFIYLFSEFLNRFINRDFFILAAFDFVETFFVKKNVFNNLKYLHGKFPVLCSFFIVVFSNFEFFKCFKFFCLYIESERQRQKTIDHLIWIRAEKIDKIREMLSTCVRLGWSKYYETFSETCTEISVFDLLFKRYILASNLEDKALKYLLLRSVRLDRFYLTKLIKLKNTMRLILMVSRKRKYVYDYYD